MRVVHNVQCTYQSIVQPFWHLVQVCQESAADGSVRAVELYVQLSPSFSLGDLTVLVGRNHVEITQKVQVAFRWVW